MEKEKKTYTCQRCRHTWNFVDPGTEIPWKTIQAIPDDSPLRCTDRELERRMMQLIDEVRDVGDTIGGSFEGVQRIVALLDEV